MIADQQYLDDIKAIEDGLENKELSADTAQTLRRDALMSLQTRKANAVRERNLKLNQESKNG